MKNDKDFLSVEDMKNIDSKIVDINNKISSHFDMYTIYQTISDYFKEYDFFWLEDVDYIEKAIDYISSFLYQPNGYIDKKVWIEGNKIIDRTFDYNDYNRWINNLSLLENIDITKEKWLWNLKEYDTQWGEQADLEWSEING